MLLFEISRNFKILAIMWDLDVLLVFMPMGKIRLGKVIAMNRTMLLHIFAFQNVTAVCCRFQCRLSL